MPDHNPLLFLSPCAYSASTVLADMFQFLVIQRGGAGKKVILILSRSPWGLSYLMIQRAIGLLDGAALLCIMNAQAAKKWLLIKDYIDDHKKRRRHEYGCSWRKHQRGTSLCLSKRRSDAAGESFAPPWFKKRARDRGPHATLPGQQWFG